MTKEEIIEMLRASCDKDRVDPEQNGFWVIVTEELVSFAKLVAEKAIKEALAQPKEPEQDNTYIYASSLATAIWQKHYMKESPKFALLDTTEGVLTQIDNMTCGLVREKPAQPEQEPVACVQDLDEVKRKHLVYEKGMDWKDFLYTTPPQRTWVGLTQTQVKLLWEGVQEEAIKSGDSLNWVFYTHINEALKEKNT